MPTDTRLKEAITNFKNAVLTKTSSLISAHNSDAQAHSDIRNAIPTDVNQLADSTNKQFTPKAHTHDDRYYTETEIQNNYLSQSTANTTYQKKSDVENSRVIHIKSSNYEPTIDSSCIITVKLTDALGNIVSGDRLRVEVDKGYISGVDTNLTVWEVSGSTSRVTDITSTSNPGKLQFTYAADDWGIVNIKVTDVSASQPYPTANIQLKVGGWRLHDRQAVTGKGALEIWYNNEFTHVLSTRYYSVAASGASNNSDELTIYTLPPALRTVSMYHTATSHRDIFMFTSGGGGQVVLRNYGSAISNGQISFTAVFRRQGANIILTSDATSYSSEATATLTAQMSPGTTAEANKTITFYRYNDFSNAWESIGTADTNSDGIATLTHTMPSTSGNYTFKAQYPGSTIGTIVVYVHD